MYQSCISTCGLLSAGCAPRRAERLAGADLVTNAFVRLSDTLVDRDYIARVLNLNGVAVGVERIDNDRTVLNGKHLLHVGGFDKCTIGAHRRRKRTYHHAFDGGEQCICCRRSLESATAAVLSP